MAQAGYDYIIIGAGSAGCVLANRLSADPSVRVCLVEAGKRDRSLLVRMPAAVGNLIREAGDFNWGFWTEPQAHMDSRRLWWPRGKGWGGSSSINGMIYIRGHRRDYDQWRQTGLTGWGFADVLPYFKRSETLDGAGSGDPFHGTEGPLWVEDAPMPSPIDRAFLDAGRQAGHPVNMDFNGTRQEGVGPYQRTLKDGERWSASYAYLRPIVDQRDNLTVISTGRVTRILIEKGRAVGVQYVAGKGGTPETIRADGEVLVCAGAVQTPPLLQLSGIGDADDLAPHGIEVKADLKEVGQNLQDHLDVSVVHNCPLPITSYSRQKGLRQLAVGLNYLLRKAGAGRDNFLQTGGFLRSRPGLEVPDIQLHFVLAKMIEHAKVKPDQDGITLHACQLRPESRGTVKLASGDPFDDPLIDPNYLATETDRSAMREAVKMCRDLLGQSAMDAYRGKEVLPGPGVQTDAEIDAFVRGHGETIYHPVSTVRMGADDAAPVDCELKVRGVDALRVVDASVMPTLIGGNTNAPTMMIAEKAADLVLGRPLLAPEDVPEPAAA
jgi:choline dehydrogenase